MAYDLDMKAFWETNEKCGKRGGNGLRIRVDIGLDDWITGYLGLDCEKYYTDFDYQQENRLKCSEVTMRELAYEIPPAVDFGVIMDASVYGGEANYESNATPTLRPAVTEPEQIDSLVEKMNSIDLLEQGLIPKYFEWREKIRARYGLELAYGGGMKGCATMMGQICGITNFLTWSATDPEQVKKLIECWFSVSRRYMDKMRQTTGYPEGRTGFYFASDVTGMLSPQFYKDYIMGYERKLFEAYAPGADDRRFYHADYHMLHQLDSLREIGVNEVNLDPYIDPEAILQKMPEATIYGQIPPTSVMLYGTPEDVLENARRNIEAAGPGRHLVLTTVGDINPGTSFENIKAMCFAAEKYGYIY